MEWYPVPHTRKFVSVVKYKREVLCGQDCWNKAFVSCVLLRRTWALAPMRAPQYSETHAKGKRCLLNDGFGRFLWCLIGDDDDEHGGDDDGGAI